MWYGFALYYIDYMNELILKTGDESGRGSILTDDGQATLFMAKSLLTALAEGISDSSVTVEILELLQKYKQRFLQLLEADSSAVNKESVVVESRKSLDQRIEEIQGFQAVKKKTVSFINMCDLIRPGED